MKKATPVAPERLSISAPGAEINLTALDSAFITPVRIANSTIGRDCSDSPAEGITSSEYSIAALLDITRVFPVRITQDDAPANVGSSRTRPLPVRVMNCAAMFDGAYVLPMRVAHIKIIGRSGRRRERH
ncbi:MAG: hypothetical protein HYW28_01120 [Rhodospirillales bacterium]|nr:hypothetical protein [Rhodospirillales bacterium]